MLLSCPELEGSAPTCLSPLLAATVTHLQRWTDEPHLGPQASVPPRLFTSLQPPPQSPQPTPLLQACLGTSTQALAGLQLQEVRTAPDHSFLFAGDRNQRKPPPLRRWKQWISVAERPITGLEAFRDPTPRPRLSSGRAPSATSGTLGWDLRMMLADGGNPSER